MTKIMKSSFLWGVFPEISSKVGFVKDGTKDFEVSVALLNSYSKWMFLGFKKDKRTINVVYTTLNTE